MIGPVREASNEVVRRPGRKTMKYAELRAAEELKKEGFEVLRKGWPDFIAWNPTTKQVRFVEVKTGEDFLTSAQHKTCSLICAATGKPVELWYGDETSNRFWKGTTPDYWGTKPSHLTPAP